MKGCLDDEDASMSLEVVDIGCTLSTKMTVAERTRLWEFGLVHPNQNAIPYIY